jgi:outer membrane biosynthesis protein TonB
VELFYSPSVRGYSRGIGSYGRGAGGLGGKRGNAPSIRLMMVSAQGALSKEVIRRIIYRHINEVRNCYNQALSNTPGLSGRIVLKIVISNTGQIESAIVESSSLNNEGVENCLIKSSDLWKFPKPNSDKKVIATVHYIFNLPNK